MTKTARKLLSWITAKGSRKLAISADIRGSDPGHDAIGIAAASHDDRRVIEAEPPLASPFIP